MDEGLEVQDHAFVRRKGQSHTRRYPARRTTTREAAVTAASQLGSMVQPHHGNNSFTRTIHAAPEAD